MRRKVGDLRNSSSASLTSRLIVAGSCEAAAPDEEESSVFLRYLAASVSTDFVQLGQKMLRREDSGCSKNDSEALLVVFLGIA